MNVTLRHVVCACAASFAAVSIASAQPPAGVQTIVQEALDGQCGVTTVVSGLTAAATIDVEIDKNRVRRTTMEAPGGTFAVALTGPLETGDEIRVLVNGALIRHANDNPRRVVARPAGIGPECRVPRVAGFDDRTNFEASGYLGWAFDNFAPNEVGGYINAASAASTHARFIGGTNAEYRFWPHDIEKRNSSDVQVWLSAETLHGVRTADVNCKDTPELNVCSKSTSEKFLGILEHASSLEVFIDPRIEFATIQRESDTPIKAYVTARFGFLAVEGAGHTYRNHHVGGGILAPSGTFAGSYVETGWGISEMFHEAEATISGDAGEPHWDRWKIDAMLMFDMVPGWKDRANPFKRLGGGMRGFVQIYIDRHGPNSKNPDSVQSFAGMQFDFGSAFGR
jgi:hypothetical protein